MSGLLQQYLSDQAERRGDALALVMGDERLTYAELETLSNRMARVLVALGCAAGDRVCLLAAKSPLTIAAMLATLKAGCTYVPIDVASPATRVGRIVRAADPAVALVLGGAAELLDQLRLAGALSADVRVGALDADALRHISGACAFGPQDLAGENETAPASGGTTADAAQLLFTSGSTGEPKGVVITHANVRAFVDWATSYFSIGPGDRVSGHPPLHFDLSTFDIYATLRAGAELHLVPPATLLPQQLASFISTSELTQWFCVPSAMTYMASFGAVPDDGFPSLDRVLWCGEVLPTPVLAHWMRRVRQASFTNLYGPTEATIASSYYTVPELPRDEAAAIPIGVACAGEELVILSDQREPVSDGEQGELCIGGVGLSPGYWRDERQTRAAFVPDPRPGRGGQRIYRTGDIGRVGSDGLLYFLGRADSQIKSRGYRIELGEIEAAINTLPGVAECAVLAVPSAGFEGTSICAAVAPERGIEISVPQLRTMLATTLPSYMLPSRWRCTDALPKNVNGKIDRRRLRELFGGDVALPGADVSLPGDDVSLPGADVALPGDP